MRVLLSVWHVIDTHVAVFNPSNNLYCAGPLYALPCLFLTHPFFFKIYFWLCRVFVAPQVLFLVAVSRGYSLFWCTAFSLWGLLLLLITGSRCVGLSSCSVCKSSVAVAHELNCSVA